MLDIHSHILPNIDDGSKSEEETLKLLRKAISEGITGIIATPHFDPTYHTTRTQIEEKVKIANKIAQDNNLEITVYPGQEVRLYAELVENLEDHVTLLNNGIYMLVELPEDHVPMYAEKVFYELQLKGVQPILVHPERNQGILRNPNILYDFVNRGVLAQITAGSVIGKFGKQTKKLSLELLDHELIHFIASDAHHLGSRDFHMAKAKKVISRKFGKDFAENLYNNADLIATNSTIYSGYPEPFKTK